MDYTKIGLRRWDDMSADDYMAMVTHPGFLGDPTVKTQHLLGQTWWEKISDTEVIGHHQLRAAHQVYTDADLKEVKLRGHGHATNEHYYRKVNGVWKFAGLKPNVRWNELGAHLMQGIERTTYVRHGFTSPQYCVYTEFISAKSSILERNTLTFTTLVMSEPASLRT